MCSLGNEEERGWGFGRFIGGKPADEAQQHVTLRPATASLEIESGALG
jgi:hypothetical protein